MNARKQLSARVLRSSHESKGTNVADLRGVREDGTKVAEWEALLQACMPSKVVAGESWCWYPQSCWVIPGKALPDMPL